MEKYLLTDSILLFMREKFLYDIYKDDYSLFEKSIENGESVIVDETKRNLNYIIQDEFNVSYYNGKFINTIKPNKKILDKVAFILNKDSNFNFLQHDVIFGTPTPIPFIIATAIEKNLPIVIDESDKDAIKYKKICKSYNITVYTRAQYLRALKKD